MLQRLGLNRQLIQSSHLLTRTGRQAKLCPDIAGAGLWHWHGCLDYVRIFELF